MPNENIGHIDCPACGKTADVRESKKKKAYIHCDDCGFQGFGRGFTADKNLREKMQKVQAAPIAKPVEPEKPPIVEPPPVQKPVEDMTIFDHLFGGKK
jgi:DNA-directed RNA polymerase subunit RPC12/RpoP